MSWVERAEVLAVQAGLGLLRILTPAAASNIVGFITRMVGPMLPVSRVGRDNLAAAFPDKTPAERDRILRGAWENLGRTIAELPHLAALVDTRSGPGIEIVDGHHVRDLTGAAIMVSAHVGNWEVMPRAAALVGVPLGVMYRAPGNPAVDTLLRDMRLAANDGARAFAKGSSGARGALAFLRGGGILGMLVDQKMNDGIRATFFGRPAMTAPAAASLALRFGCKIVPAYCVRLGPARLRVVCETPLTVRSTGNQQEDVAAITQAINDRVESWVRARPEQWLWLHRRWPKPE